MRILNFYGDGRRATLLSILAAFRAARRGGVDVQIGPLDEQLLSAYGLFVSGPEEEVERFGPLMIAEVERLKIEVEPAEYLGEIE